jgi:hypothetical protein
MKIYGIVEVSNYKFIVLDRKWVWHYRGSVKAGWMNNRGHIVPHDKVCEMIHYYSMWTMRRIVVSEGTINILPEGE